MSQPHMALAMQYTVIDENVVLDALLSERDLETKGKPEANARSKGDGRPGRPQQEEIRLEEVECLRLSYKNILRIDNLVGFKQLHTLCLDNNVIEEVDNLGHLVNLQWLDLSFNKIKRISGLENLTALKDLSLYSNEIETIENLEQCERLECLSLGRNKINKLEDLLYLRQFKHLRLVTLDGNPVCKDPEYRMYVLAHLEKLKYLDYALVEHSEVVSAREQYQDELLEAEERDSLLAANEAAARQHREYLERLREAHIEVVETLFDDMFREDKELPKLKLLPGFDNIYDSYKHEFRVNSEATINIGLEIFQRFVEEKKRMEEALDKVTTQNESASIKLVEAFNRTTKRLHQQAQALLTSKREESVLSPAEGDDATGAEPAVQIKEEDLLRDLEQHNKDRVELREKLMTIEIQQVQQLKKLCDVYESRAGAIRNDRVDHATNFFRAVEELENSFANALEELAQNLTEKLANNMLEDLSDDTVAFLSDRDNLMVAIQGAHDVHLGKLLAQEDSMRDGITRELATQVKDMKKQFNEQNRDRVFEIKKMNMSNKAQLDQMISELSYKEEDF